MPWQIDILLQIMYFVVVYMLVAAEAALNSVPRNFSVGHLGGLCAKKPNQCLGPIRLTCKQGICSCEKNYAPYFVVGHVGCFGLNGSACIAGNVNLPKYLTSVTEWDAEYKKLTDEAKLGTVTGKEATERLLQMEIISHAGMAGKSSADWSCRGGTCDSNRCADGVNPAILPLDILEHTPGKVETSGQAKIDQGLNVKTLGWFVMGWLAVTTLK